VGENPIAIVRNKLCDAERRLFEATKILMHVMEGSTEPISVAPALEKRTLNIEPECIT
jgi:hypothetical protein